jgi:hypothetical protein
VFLLDLFLVGLLKVLFTAISFSCCFEIAEEGFLRACLPTIGGVELLFLASFSSCSFEMAEEFSRDFLPAIRGVEILFSASFFSCLFEMAEGSQGHSCLVVSHQELLQMYWAQIDLHLSFKCRRQIYQHQPTHHSG